MELTDEQKIEVANWVRDGASIGDVQGKLDEHFSLSMTYMDVRFLVDDLELTLRDQPSKDAEKEPAAPAGEDDGPIPFPGNEDQPADAEEWAPEPAMGSVSVSVDPIQRPGAVLSGSVTFSDGKTAEWQLDQTGRLGLIPKEEGYKPTQEDIQEFQMALQTELQKQGM